jgi:GT2 family glycosyltransferase
MISVVIPARNARPLTLNCLNSLLSTFRQLNWSSGDVEFILIDDNSDPEQMIVEAYKDFRRQTASQVTIVRFKERRYYGWGCAYGFSRAKGSAALFISYDMAITPDYIRTLTGVAALDESFGIVRGTSQYVDCFPQYQFVPPLPTRSLDDVVNFSAYVAKYHGMAHSEDPLLTGDAMLIKRSVFQKIGCFDTRFPFGYFSDIDFGLRALRAGFKMICAKGAWLHHEGAGAYKDESTTKKIDMSIVHAERMKKVDACYKVFRDKWDPSMPPDYSEVRDLSFPNIRNMPKAPVDEYQPFVPTDDPLVEIL